MTPAEVGLLALVGGLLALDRTAVGQLGFSQPIAAGPLVGWLLGDAPTGLLVGGILQLLYAGALPIGASVPPDEGAAALVATAAAAAGGPLLASPAASAPALLAMALLAGLAAGEAGRGVDVRVRRANIWFAHRADAAAARSDDRAVARLALGGIGLWFVTGAAVALLFAPAAAFLVRWAASAVSATGAVALGLVATALPSLAVASALTAMRAPARLALFVGTFAAGAAALGLAAARP